jgi:LuxR family transcriptional regulator, regulator of acetate metabolism
VAVDDPNIEELRRIAPDLAPSISRLTVPAYVLDLNGVVRWLNAAAIAAFGDLRGKRIAQIVERDYVTFARQEFAAKILGTVEATEGEIAVRTVDGRRVSVEVSSTTVLDQGSIVGVFGLADPAEEPIPRTSTAVVHLTPRQTDVLRHLALGHSTGTIAEKLGIATETVRNHVRAIISRLGVHNRLEAVMRAHALGIL